MGLRATVMASIGDYSSNLLLHKEHIVEEYLCNEQDSISNDTLSSPTSTPKCES